MKPKVKTKLPEGSYFGLFLAIGVAIGISLDNLPIGIAIGLVFGAAFEAKKDGNIKPTKEKDVHKWLVAAGVIVLVIAIVAYLMRVY